MIKSELMISWSKNVSEGKRERQRGREGKRKGEKERGGEACVERIVGVANDTQR